ncbi:MAG: DEAD/DEAH box helicase family protein [Gemmatimonadaceae bacterium]|nr:DEAD/DEAH box helicase family protein [Gemmatimonadaceae bacterium]
MNSEDDPPGIESALAEQEARVARLDHELAEARAHLLDLRERQAVALGVRPSVPAPSPPGTSSRLSVPEKISRFRTLFRGREDVYPKFWHNPKLNRSGYAPACANEWFRGVREKPLLRGGDALNREFLPVTDRVIEDHLRGRHTIGVYPLLTDDTCWFLAADFDDDGWRDDVAAFAETCRTFGLEPSVERSRSGRGAHVWFFFSSPVPARTARTVGCFLITETMVRRHQLRLTSYDRLFPNQDTLPKGGFGNLIALPLQRSAAEQGNTLFLNDRWEPQADQWEYLASVERHTAAALELLAREAEKSGRILGVRAVRETDTQPEDQPWELAPSPMESQSRRLTDPVPECVAAVIAQRLFVPLVGLPSSLITQIKQLAAFQNPEFYQKQRLRLSTHDTPRIVSCAEELPAHISLPRGCLDDLQALLASYGVALVVEDRRTDGAAADVRFTGTLSAEQAQAVETLALTDTGVLVAPPGSGKTVIAIALLARRGRNALVLVHRRPLVDQWVSRIAAFTGLQSRDIGQITSGKRHVTGAIDVATVQSLVRNGVVDDLVASYGTVIVDECHHVAAVSIERVLSHVWARYILGLTATPTRRDGLHPIVHMQLGPVRHVIGTGAALRGRLSHRLIVRDTPFAAGLTEQSIQELYAALGASEARNDLLFDDILCALEVGRSPLVLTERRDHLEYLANRLRPFTRHLVVMHGGTGTKVRREVMRQLADIPPDEERLVLATGRYLGEGFDDARLDSLFLAMPFAWRGTLVQYAGRLHRAYAGKREVHVYDYVDRAIPVLVRMFEKRLRGYRAIGYQMDL